MNDIVISIENLSKQYRLGEVGTGTLSNDLNRWWASIRGKEDPNIVIGTENSKSAVHSKDLIWALYDFNLEIKRGEILGIIGKNGAGKSTLLKLVSRITSPTTGTIKAKGRIASLLEVGTGMHPEMTARENIYLNGAILGMMKNEITNKFDDIIAFAGCDQFVDTPIKRFSSGMRVRLGFAVAAFLEPDILIVDEVLAVGDLEFQKKAIGKMKEISKESERTVLFVSHNMAAVKSMCTRAVLLEDGKIKNVSDADIVINEYRSTNSTLKIPLKERKDRSGSGIFQFSEIAFSCNKNVIDNTAVVSGENVQINIEYISALNTSLENAHFSITVKDLYDNPLFSCATRHTGYKFDRLRPKGTVQLKIFSLPLLPGEYQLDLFCKINEVKADYIIGAVTFQVLENDIYGTGIIPQQSKHGSIFVKHNWSIKE